MENRALVMAKHQNSWVARESCLELACLIFSSKTTLSRYLSKGYQHPGLVHEISRPLTKTTIHDATDDA